MNTRHLCAAAIVAASLCAPGWAQTGSTDPIPENDAEVVVTGTRASEPTRIDQNGGAITVLDADALDRRQTRAVSDILRDVPGVAVSRIAGQTQVRLRGAEANHVLVLIDGIEVSDPFSGEFDFGTLAADDTARVEVLRGQQSAIYGSDAIGGVIQYITPTGREAPGYRARVEAGSFGTLDAAARAAGVAGDLDYALSATINTTDGTSNARGGGRDLRNDTGAASLKANWTPSPDARVTAVGRYSRTMADFNDSDGDPASPTFGEIVDTPGNRFRNEALYGLVRAEVDLFDRRWSHAVTAQVADTDRDGFNAAGRSYGDVGTRLKGSYETTLRLGDDAVRHLLTAAVDVERERYRNTDPSGFAFTGPRHSDNLGLVGQYELRLGDRGSLGGSVRYDDNQRFAGSTTYRFQSSYRLGSGTRLRAAAGSGVKNPGFYELFGYIDGRFIGNADLRPEKSKGWEAGVEQALRGDALVLGGTYFQSTLRDEIVTTYPAPTFIATPANSAGRSRQRGVEAYLNARLGDAWRIDATYTYLHARESGSEEVRRPSSIGSVAVSWRAPGDRLSLTGVVRYNGATDDLAFTDPSYVPVRVRLHDYTLVNLNADLRLTERLSLFGRVENLLDEHYEDVFSFTNPGVSAYAGVRAVSKGRNTTMNQDTAGPNIAWPLALAAAAVLGSLATACMMPFVAVATIAAASMPRREAVTAVIGTWAVNQLLGFGLLGYPMTAYAATWGLALGGSSVAALLVARRVIGASSTTATKLGAAFVIAFAAYEGLLFAFATVEGGTGTFTPAIVLSILLNDAAWLLGLALLHVLLTRAAPRVFGTPRALRLV